MNLEQYRATAGRRTPKPMTDYTRPTPPANPVLTADTAAALKAMLVSKR